MNVPLVLVLSQGDACRAVSKGNLARMKVALSILLFLAFISSLFDATAAEADKTTLRSPDKGRVGIDTRFGELAHEAAAALQRSRYEEAVAKATAGLQMKPDGRNAAILYRVRGVADESLGDFTNALADYTDAIRSDPAVEKVHYYRGALYSRRGEFFKAIADFTVAIRKESDNAGSYCSRARAYVATGRQDLARSDFQRVTRSPLKDGGDYAIRAIAYFAIGQYKDAASDLVTAKRMQPAEEFVLGGAAWFAATCPSGW